MKQVIEEFTVDAAIQAEKISCQTKTLVFRSEAMLKVIRLCARVANTDATVLLQGETGTGKELLARFLHEASARKNKPFVKVDCGTLPETLLESELFGYEKGAFTGASEAKKGKVELAHGGTLFLDEIVNMGVHAQARLLRLLQDKEFERVGGTKTLCVDARVIVATNKDLKVEVREGRFRDDLFYRLNIIPIVLPPLRERREDIQVLIDYFLQRLNMKYGARKTVNPDALNALTNYDFPGNVRELENLMERLVLTMETDEILATHLPAEIMNSAELDAPDKIDFSFFSRLTYADAVEAFTKLYVMEKLKEHKGNITHAAKAMNIHRQQLQSMMRQMGVRKPDEWRRISSY